MMVSNMRNWTDLPPDLVTILRRAQELNLFGMLYVCFLEDGTVQAVVQKRGQGADTHGGNDPDVLQAILRAVGPPEGGSWAEHLQSGKPSKRKTTPVLNIPDVEDDDDDYMDVV